MEQTADNSKFEIRTAAYFKEKAMKAKGTGKMLVALEMSKYITAARQHGLSFDEFEKAGFKFATVPDINSHED